MMNTPKVYAYERIPLVHTVLRFLAFLSYNIERAEN